ncbi:MAG: peptide chain release factor N(5)-glutamine methyltransferase [Planctomycetes bacterium]|nr:peptide chain release factor N(5)-glutamine methyltransferase [Planctomycetota bacterium]
MPDVSSDDWTIGRLIEWTRDFFARKGVDQPRLEAEILLAHVLGFARIDLYMRYEQEVEEQQRAAFRDLVRRRTDGEPARYLVGTCEFMSLAFKVTPDVLIPRPETEMLVEEVARRVRASARTPLEAAAEAAAAPSAAGAETGSDPAAPEIIELCTGSGAVAVSLAVHLPTAQVTATDLSEAALAVARTNAEAHGVADRVTLLAGDLYDALDAADARPADFLLANPPYVAEGEWDGLPAEIRRHEPRGALVAGPDGTEVIERIVKGARAYLKPGGVMLVEIGESQGRAAREMAEAARGLADVDILKDYAGHDRILLARRQG